jgi:6-phosphogluconolactonase (cycloisomerase 2 family)
MRTSISRISILAASLLSLLVLAGCDVVGLKEDVKKTVAAGAASTTATTYTVTYDGNAATSGSVPVDSSVYLQGATVTVLSNSGSLVKTGCNFSGWNTKADGSGTGYAVGASFTMGSANATLYALWVAMGTVAPPTFSPAAGAYTSAQTVSIASSTSGAFIRYTTDSSSPAASGGAASPVTVAVSASMTIKAIAYASGMTSSSVAAAVYTISVAAPTFGLAAGSYAGTQSASISAPAGASVYYTTDHSAPSKTNGTLYSGPFAVAYSQTINAIALKEGCVDSTVASAAYTITQYFLYAADYSDNRISAYLIDSSTGSLTALSGSTYATNQSGASHIAITPAGSYAYVTNRGSNSVSAYKIDSRTGVLSELVGSPYAVGINPLGIAINPAGTYVYIACVGSDNKNSIDGFKIDQSTGALGMHSLYALDSVATTHPYDIAISPSGTNVFVTDQSSSRIYKGTVGAAGSLSFPASPPPIATGGPPYCVTVDPRAGNYTYVANRTVDTISAYTNIAGGFGSLATFTIAAGAQSENMAISPNGYFAYVPSTAISNIYEYNINMVGQLESMATPSISTVYSDHSEGLVDPTGQYLYVSLYTNNSIAGFKIGSTGGLSSLSPATVSTKTGSIGINPLGMAIATVKGSP